MAYAKVIGGPGFVLVPAGGSGGATDFSDLTGFLEPTQVDRTVDVVAEAATVTVPVNDPKKTAATGTLATLAFSGATGSPVMSQWSIDIAVNSGAPYTVSFTDGTNPLSVVFVGPGTGSSTSIALTQGYHILQMRFVGSTYIMAHSVQTVPFTVAQGGTAVTYDTINGAEATIASATTTNIGALTSNKVSITGVTTITGFDSVAAGIAREGRFTGILTLTHNASSLILPGGANITTAAGDRFKAVSLGSGNWVVYVYTRVSGKSVIPPADSDVTFTDITTGNSSTSNHGFLLKLDNTSSHYMDGTGGWSVPAGAGAATYAGASPPTTDVGNFIIQKTSINMGTGTASTGQDVFTVPTSRAFVCTGASIVVTSVTGGTTGAFQFQIIESGASKILTTASTSATTTPVAGSYYASNDLGVTGPYTQCAAANKVQVKVNTAQASTTLVGTVFVRGFYSA